MTHQSPVVSKLAHAVVDIPKLAPVGRTKIFEAIRDGHLIARKLGRRTMILDEDLRAWLSALPVSRPRAA